MNFGILGILTLIGSVGMFLYGMKLMSEGLQKAAGNRLRNILAMMTNNKFVGALTGIFITALVQSSSATTTMIVSFVNAGLISLQQSMAVIFGANVGTTFTAWIISLFGFKVDISAFAIPLFAFGVPLLFMKKSPYTNWGEFLIGFALLFLGLDFLNGAVPDLKSNPAVMDALRRYSDLGFGSIMIFAGVGLVLTMIVQASSATFAIALIMCSKGWITFDLAAALVLGGNIGTCITPIIASVSGNVMAKRAAAGHLLFNLIGSLWALVIYRPYMKLISWITTGCVGDPNAIYSFANNSDPAVVTSLMDGSIDTSVPANAELAAKFANMQYYVSFGLSMFHTVFNLINIFLMIWFTNGFVKIVTFLVPSGRKSEEDDLDGKPHLEFISGGLMSTSELSILQAHKEILLMSERTFRMHEMIGQMYSEATGDEFNTLFERVQKYENISDNMEVEIASYLSKVADGRLSDDSKHSIQMKLREISEIESIGDSYYNMARILKRRNENSIVFSDEMNKSFTDMFALVGEAYKQMSDSLIKHHHVSSADLVLTMKTESQVNAKRNELKEKNIIDLNEGKYEYATGSAYMDLIVECEKIGDYIVNVVEALVDLKPGKGTIEN